MVSPLLGSGLPQPVVNNDNSLVDSNEVGYGLTNECQVFPVLEKPVVKNDNSLVDSNEVGYGLTNKCQVFPVLEKTVPLFKAKYGTKEFINVYQSCLDGVCDCTYFIEGESSQLLPCRLASFLKQSCFEISEVESDFIWAGVTEGFKIVDPDCSTKYECKNYKSILEGSFYKEYCDILTEEVKNGLVSEVYQKPVCIHSLGGVEKSNGTLRPITDCSMPERISINNYMESTAKPFSYNSINTVVAQLDKNDYMCVVDLKSAYRSINVYGPHTAYQGFSWDFGDGVKYYKSNRLTFGLKCAPYIFNRISDFIVKIANFYGVEKIVNYLDDFIIIAKNEEECLRQRNVLIEIMEFMGFNISYNKVTEPSKVTVFLGITIDSEKMEISLPQDKVKKLKDCLEYCMGKRFISKKALQKVGGLMSFCSQVVKGGRTFSRRLFDLCAKARNKGVIRVSGETQKDFKWWWDFCAVFNCRSLILNDNYDLPMVSDASIKGFGAWCGKDYFYGSWVNDEAFFEKGCGHQVEPPVYDNLHVHDRNINVYELYPVLVGIKRWAKTYANTRVNCITDNMQVLAMLNSGRSKNKLCMEWLREIFWICFIHNIEIYSTYIKSEDNVLADQLSRLQYKGFPEKCQNTLIENEMCCSISRLVAGGSEGKAKSLC